jgi:hypothetical protein
MRLKRVNSQRLVSCFGDNRLQLGNLEISKSPFPMSTLAI